MLNILEIINDNSNPDAKLVILGDKNQCINKYNDANHRFLTLNHKIFQNKHPWKQLKLMKVFSII